MSSDIRYRNSSESNTIHTLTKREKRYEGLEKLFKNLNSGLLVLALIALVFLFVVYLIYAAALFRFPFDYDQGEGFELWDAVLLSRPSSIA